MSLQSHTEMNDNPHMPSCAGIQVQFGPHHYNQTTIQININSHVKEIVLLSGYGRLFVSHMAGHSKKSSVFSEHLQLMFGNIF